METLPSNMPKKASDRIYLRQLKPEDHHLLNLLNNDEGVMKYLDYEPPSPEEDQAQVRRIIDNYSQWPSLGHWIAESPTGEFLGWFALTPRDCEKAELESKHPATELELGYRLRRRFWGQGLATEGSRVLIRYAFGQHPDVHRVFATTMFVNTPSRRVMEKCGMRYVKTFHVEFDDPLPGTELGEVLHEVTREDWEKGAVAD